MRRSLLEVQHPPAVRECARRVAVCEPAGELVGEQEAEPDRRLAQEIRVAARQMPAACCNDSGHDRASLTREAALDHPPICDIDRDARTKPGSLTRCFSSLWRTAKRMKSAICESEEPSRRRALRSHSRLEKRQVRSWPSAVSRIRSQLEQKGSETGLTNPISPTPSANVNRRAVDEGFASSSTSGPNRSSISAR